jgi:hypothetical protein
MLVALCSSLVAQNPQLHTKNGSRFPTVIFTSVLWTADPSYYSIAIDAAGTATYQSAPDSIEKTGAPYIVEFQVSDRTRRTAFNVTRQLDWFRERADESVASAQNASIRTLGYHDAQFHNQITFSSSSNAEIEELASVFEEISETLECGRRLAYFHKSDNSALDAELDRVQASADRRSLREFSAIAPILRSIVSDNRLESAARHKAEALLNGQPRH